MSFTSNFLNGDTMFNWRFASARFDFNPPNLDLDVFTYFDNIGLPNPLVATFRNNPYDGQIVIDMPDFTIDNPFISSKNVALKRSNLIIEIEMSAGYYTALFGKANYYYPQGKMYIDILKHSVDLQSIETPTTAFIDTATKDDLDNEFAGFNMKMFLPVFPYS